MLLVITFLMSIFMITQYFLRETIEGQEAALTDRDSALTVMSEQVSTLTSTLALEENARVEAESAAAELESQLDAARLSLASTTEARDLEREAAAKAAAERAAFEALTLSLRDDLTSRETELSTAELALNEEEAQRAAQAAATELLRERLESAQSELTAMTLDLEERRKDAEETLLLLAGAREARANLEAGLSERNSALQEAREQLATASESTIEEKKQIVVLNAQVRELREQLSAVNNRLSTNETERTSLRATVEVREEEIETLGARLNVALATQTQLLAERNEALEEVKQVLEEQVDELEDFRSEFFGRVRGALADRNDVQIVGDRFVFQSEVLFAPGSAELGSAGETELGKFATILNDIAADLPGDLNWILRIDGHTDERPLTPGRTRFRNNWELSQARALSVAEYLIESEDVLPRRIAVTGFGEFQPLSNDSTDEAYARNRRIELKLTER